MKQVLPPSGDGTVGAVPLPPAIPEQAVGAPPAVVRLVAAGDGPSLVQAVLELMEESGLGCPHLGLWDVRTGRWRLAGHRGVSETLVETVGARVEEAAREGSEAAGLLPGGLRHRLAPIRGGGELLGVVGWLEPEEEAAREVAPIAPLVQAALQRIARGVKQRKRSSQREAVRRAALAVGEARDLETMLEAIAERARLLTGAEAVAVRGRGAAATEDGWIVRGHASVIAPRPEMWPHGIPIRHQGRQLAELRLRGGGGRPDDEDLALVRLFAEHVGALVASASARSQLQREVSAQSRTLRWLGSVVEHLPVATLLLFSSGESFLVRLNRRAKVLLDREEETATIEELAPLLLTEEGRPFPASGHPLARVARGESIHRLEAQLVGGEEGAPRFIVFHGEQLPGDGECRAAVIALEDVSAFKTLERMRAQWASLITHDLRQPLTSILGFASLLAQQQDLPPPIRNRIAAIGSAARRLVRISRDLLDASLMDARHLGLERAPTDVAALVRNVAEELSRETVDKPIRVVLDADLPRLDVDPVRIEQVLENLLSNARKYGRPGSEIVVHVERAPDEVRIHVRNVGDPLDEDELSRIFTRFYRGRNAVRAGFPGMGLGLYICRTLVEAHGGRIWAACTPSEEVVFSFALPLQTCQPTAPDVPSGGFRPHSSAG